MKSVPAMALIIILLLTTVGCVERYMLIKAPEGTQIWVDGKLSGRINKPGKNGLKGLKIPFLHYGMRNIEVRKYGCRTINKDIAISAPWYQYFPIDLIFDILFPFTLTDEHAHEFEMQEIGDVDTTALLKRAIDLKKELEDE